MSDYLTMTFSDTLVVMTCWCGINHAVPQNLRDFQMRQHNDGKQQVMSIFCPLGHQHAPAGRSESEKLRERLAREERATTRLRAEKDQVEASLRATKGANTKLKQRIANGVCPCCHRTFKNVQRHMTTQHPDYVPEPEAKSK
jgi:hypothetical protein